IETEVPVPVIEVNAIMNDNDLTKIEAFIVRNESDAFSDYIRDDLVFIRQQLDSKEAVLSNFDDRFREMGLADDTFVSSVMEREAVMPTSFGNLIAIPHPIVPQSGETFLSFMTLEKPVFWAERS